MAKSKVYYTDFRTVAFGDGLPTKLQKLCKKAGIDTIDMDGKFVAIKLHFGELGNISYLRPNYARAIVDLVKSLGGKPFFDRLQHIDVPGKPQECAGAPRVRLAKRLYAANGGLPHFNWRRPEGNR